MNEWHLKGPCTWVSSCISILSCVLLLVVNLRNRKSYSIFTLYAVLIALSGFITALTAQTTFIQEGIPFREMPPWLVALREFTLSKSGTFLQDFFPRALDLLVVADCLNRYLIICKPERKETFLTKTITIIVVFLLILISCVFAGLTMKMEADKTAMVYGHLINPAHNLSDRRYTWLVCGILKLVLSSMKSVFLVFLTVKNVSTLKRSIAFLQQTNANPRGVIVYKKLVRFNYLMCVAAFIFNVVCGSIQEALLFRQHAEAHAIVYIDYNLHDFDKILNMWKYALKVIFCLKPGCYNVIYTWLKSGALSD